MPTPTMAELLKRQPGDMPRGGREVIDRFAMLPIGQSEDGSLTWAWPGMIKDMYEGAIRSYEQGRQLPRVDDQGHYAGTPRAEPLDAFNAANMALIGAFGARATGLTKDVGDIGMFAGRGAKTADHAKLAQAERMASEGVPREQIWNDTGWFQGVDGKWRFEIDDSGSRYAGGSGKNLASFIDHPALADAYPSMAASPARALSPYEEMIANAGFDPSKGQFIFSKSTGPDAHSSALHEMQHWIQETEGFAPGSNHQIATRNIKMRNPEYAAAQRAVDAAEASAPKGINKLNPFAWWGYDDRISGAWLKQRDAEKWLRPTSDQVMAAYRAAPGEVEARNVQTRMGMTPDERMSTPPWATSDHLFANDSRASIPGVVVNAVEGAQPKGAALPYLMMTDQQDQSPSMSSILRRQ